MDIPAILEYALTLTATFKYLLVFVGTVIEGPVIMLAGGFLIHLGVFDPAPLYVTILAADLVGDVLWYWVGYRFAEPFMKKHGHFLSVTPETFEKVKGLFAKYHERILIFSKLTIGFGFALATLIVAGATHVPFKKYMIINILGEVILVFVLLSVGYFFAELYKYVDDGLKVGFAVGSLIVLTLAIYGFTGYMKKRVSKM
jgi:membrane protein DedA with SNARE-associated domain